MPRFRRSPSRTISKKRPIRDRSMKVQRGRAPIPEIDPSVLPSWLQDRSSLLPTSPPEDGGRDDCGAQVPSCMLTAQDWRHRPSVGADGDLCSATCADSSDFGAGESFCACSYWAWFCCA